MGEVEGPADLMRSMPPLRFPVSRCSVFLHGNPPEPSSTRIDLQNVVYGAGENLGACNSLWLLRKGLGFLEMAWGAG